MTIDEIFSRKDKKRNNIISIILPIYNEEKSVIFVLEELFQYLENYHRNYYFEITFINDCSTDNSKKTLLHHSLQTPCNVKVSVATLSKNSGSHIAISAGINISRGELVIIMASDGQDPSFLIGNFIDEWISGSKLILASRQSNLDQGVVSNFLSRVAWKIMNWSTQLNMPLKGCDVLAMDRNLVDSYNKMDERNTTFIFRVLALGYPYKEFSYIKRERFSGKSKWSLLQKISIMFDAITGFSNRPLRLITKLGLFIFVILMIRWCYIVFRIYFLGEKPTDLIIIINTILTSISIIILLLGVIGDYIWRILDEVRKRPLFEIDTIEGDFFNNIENDNK